MAYIPDRLAIQCRPRATSTEDNWRTRMRILILLASCLLTTTTLAQQEKHLLYMTTPDAAQPGGSGEGLLLFDIDNGHRFVRRIDVPSFKEGVRGISACAATGRLYITTS